MKEFMFMKIVVLRAWIRSLFATDEFGIKNKKYFSDNIKFVKSLMFSYLFLQISIKFW